MSLRIINPIPAKKISEYVQNILVIENSQVTKPFVLPLYPNGSPTLLFQTSKGKIKDKSNYLTLFGQTVRPEKLTISESFTLIAYYFKPYSLASLFGLSPKELTDNPIELDLLKSSKVACLQEQLLNSSSTDQMINLLDDYVFSLIRKVNAENKLINFATSKLSGNYREETLQKVQNELYLTERTFQRMFRNHVGISPDKFRRISQFNTAFKQLQHRKFEKLSDIAFKNGYADQSHFIRSFKEFTNITPKDYLNFKYSR